VDEVQANGARQLQEGWMHIHGASFATTTLARLALIPEFVVLIHFLDERNIPPLGRIGDPDDIIASVRVHDGEVNFTAVDVDWPWCWIGIYDAETLHRSS